MPIGLISLSSTILGTGRKVQIIDLNHEIVNGRLDLSNSFYEKAASLIVSSSPFMVGFSTMCNSYPISLKLAEMVKKKSPDILILLGGPQASVVDIDTLNAFPFVDYIIRGEAEVAFPRFIERVSRNENPHDVPNLTYRKDGNVIRTFDAPLLENLDALPLLAYDIFPYELPKVMPLDVGRGCPFSCSFCTTSTYWRRRYRLKSAGRVIQEMTKLYQDYGIKEFVFEHDLFTFDRKRILSFCEILSGSALRGISWGCSARIDTVDKNMLRKLKNAGCTAIFYGIESGSDRVQKMIRKNLNLERVISVVEATACLGLDSTASFIVGFPDEKEEDIIKTLNIIQRLKSFPKTTIQLHIMTPLAGSLDYEKYHQLLRYDGYFSTICGNANIAIEEEWIRGYPQIFSNFYYFEPMNVARDIYRDIDLFIMSPFMLLERTMQLLLKDNSLWEIYLRWRKWRRSRGKGDGRSFAQTQDTYFLDFHDFVLEELNVTAESDIATTLSDEILKYYFTRYGNIPVKEETAF